MNNKIQNFALIIGAQKCGTTSLYNYLVQHPEIGACKYKEPGFFSHDNRFAKGFDYYQSLWNCNPNVHKIALEASTHYTAICPNTFSFTNAIAAERIAKCQQETNSNFKFIYIIRNPIERIESHYTYIKAQPNGSSLLSSFPENGKTYMIDTSRYATQIEEFYKRFDSKNILLLNFEDIRNDSFNLIQKVCKFLGVDSNYNFQQLNIKHNHHGHQKNIVLPGYYSLRQTELIYSILPLIPKEAKLLFRNLFGRKVKNEYFKLSLEDKKYILKELQDDLRKLSLEYGFNVNCWDIKI